MFYVDLRHEGLGKFRRISGSDRYVVEQRAQSQRAIWDAQWQRQCEIEKIRSDRNARLFHRDAKKEEAIKRTEEAQQEIAAINSVLKFGLTHDPTVDWASLQNREIFPEARPHVPTRQVAPREPLRSDGVFQPKSDILSWLFSSVKLKRKMIAEKTYLAAHEKWVDTVNQLAQNYAKATEFYKSRLSFWETRKAEFDQAKDDDNAKVIASQKRYQNKDREAVIEYVDMVLSRSLYPNCFPKQWQIALAPETGVLVIDYELPSLESLPSLKAVKYVQSRDVFESSYLKNSELAQIYDDAMYNTCLRTLYEIFASDSADAIKTTTFNGWVNFIDKSTGKEARACIMSLQAGKGAFLQVNLAAVEPKTCFRALKGVGSAKLAGMAAVVPILRFNKNDDRFVAAHDVIDELGEATNVAAIPWEEFEHLVRDIFEKEFSSNGGEVKITRASRDHGVDAIAFDPDPIRGGKIVIQAKRYTNVVGVAAVRDLYGTLINEGATKGILVTTSQYGPDSYEFAKSKPITLLDGGNLLSLLEKHGHRARIDLVEAKKMGTLRDER
jgi:restriction system protein